jgi:hypothetical protein
MFIIIEESSSTPDFYRISVYNRKIVAEAACVRGKTTSRMLKDFGGQGVHNIFCATENL